MRKTSFGLGLAGSITAFVIGAIMLIIAFVTLAVGSVKWDVSADGFDGGKISIDDEDFHISVDEDFEDIHIDVFEDSGRIQGRFTMPGGRGFPNIFFGVIGAWLFVGSICLILAGILGIIGTSIAKKRRSIAAGVLLLLAAILSMPSLYGFNASALLIPAGVLAFIKDKNEQDTIEAKAADEDTVI